MTALGSIQAHGAYSLILVNAQPALTRQVRKIASLAEWEVITCERYQEIAVDPHSEGTTKISAVLAEVPSSSNEACDLISAVKIRHPELPVLAATCSRSIPHLVQMLRAGANAFIAKPLRTEHLSQAMQAISSNGLLEDLDLHMFREEPDGVVDFASLIGADGAFRAAIARAALAARGQGHVVVEGESGTGKKMLAKAMHASSPRAMMPLRLVNLREVASCDLESQLFGHEKGAFPGAFERRAGILQDCDGGTLVLDGIEVLSLSQQRTLEEAIRAQRFRPLGATYGFQLNARVLALTQRSLAQMVEDGDFLAELYELLGSTHVVLPALRDRTGDVAILARHFLARMVEEMNLRKLVLSYDAATLLQSFQWPANIRQLQATLLRALVRSGGSVLTARDFPYLPQVGRKQWDRNRRTESACSSLHGVDIYTKDGNLRTLSAIEADVIQLAIKHYRGRPSEAARHLGIGRSTLYRKMAELGLISKSTQH